MKEDDMYEDEDYKTEFTDDKYLGRVIEVDEAKRKMVETLLKMTDDVREERRRLTREKTSKLQMIDKAYEMRIVKLGLDLQKMEDSGIALTNKPTFHIMKREHLEELRLAREAEANAPQKTKVLNTSISDEDDDETEKDDNI